MILMDDMKQIEDYFASNIHKPFYMVVGDVEYKKIVQNLRSRAINVLRLSDCCRSDDKIPDLDILSEELKTADISCDDNDIVVLGLGEYLAMCGDNKARSFLAELEDYYLGTAQVVILLRCVESQINALIQEDRRLLERGNIVFSDDLQTSLSFKFTDPKLGIYEINGFKNVLKALEDGASGEIKANTQIEFGSSLLPIQYVKDSYWAISHKIYLQPVPKECGTEEMWKEMLFDLQKVDFNIEALFEEYDFSDFQSADFYALLYDNPYKSWLFYISLVYRSKSFDGTYLGYVLAHSKGINDFKQNVLNAIINIPHTDEKFDKFYQERKKILSQYPEAEIALFVNANRINPAESVYKLTDNTLVEKQEIIIWIANHGIPENLEKMYPDLAAYANKYSFNNQNLNAEFASRITNYFETYKKLKLTNTLTEEFLNEVDKLASELIYNRLPKRDELVKDKNDGSTQLFWVDALGVEYLSFIVELARKKDLRISVEIGRAELPTITSVNNNFYKNWPEELRHPKEEELDEVKHKEKGGYYFSKNNPYPIHLAKELDIVGRVIDEITTTLRLNNKYERVVIASDHGASRLAVLRNKQEKYDTDTKGEHSGRCCKYFSSCDLPFAIKEEEQGYIVLADYGRFKGSRAANVEVHGGASLEEVVVPVITLSLNDNSLNISVVDEDKIKADHKKGISFVVYVNKVIRNELIINYKSKRYLAKQIDENHYRVDIPDIRKSGTYVMETYLGNDLVGNLEVKASSKSGSINDEFDDLFK